MLGLLWTLGILETLGFRNIGVIIRSINDTKSIGDRSFIYIFTDIRDIRGVRDIMNIRGTTDIRALRDIRGIRDVGNIRDIRDIIVFGKMRVIRGFGDI
jgi:hypothetical protein